MSERLNSVDIEDVLSSIRRLVSDDQRPGAKGTAPPVAPAEPPQADKLILTPALRIAPDAESEPEPGIPAPEAPVQVEPTMSFHSVRQERSAARLDAVMGQVARGLDAGPGDWETAVEPPTRFESDWSDTAEPLLDVSTPDMDDAGDLSELKAAQTVWPDNLAEAPFVELESDDGDISGQAAPTEVDAFPVDILPGAQDGELAADTTHDVTSDGTRDATAEDWPLQDWAAPGEPDMVAPDPTVDAEWPEFSAASIDSQPVALAEEPAMTDKDDPADLPDWARMEAEPAEMDVQDTPAAAPDRLGDDPRWADAAEAEIRRELEDEATASAFARFADDDLDERPFDEDMLRDLVRDIIREELQGALGERITRNVRKLVRAEIARALAVRDFE
jgi:hypothetical protein